MPDEYVRSGDLFPTAWVKGHGKTFAGVYVFKGTFFPWAAEWQTTNTEFKTVVK